MPRDNPLEIPEIAGIVASYLEPNDLASCLRVSKKWLALFLPHRWKSVDVGFKPSKHKPKSVRSFTRFGPHGADIYRHRRLIHNLTMCGDLAGLDKYNYPNLRKLVVDCSGGAKDRSRMIFLELVEMFPLVVCLKLKSVEIEAATWLTLSTHSHITTLRLWDIFINSSVASGFWRACTNLERLDLISVTVDGAVLDDVIFLRLTSLALCDVTGLDAAQQLGIIFHCPALRFFEWIWDDDDTRTVMDPIPNGSWPRLEGLDIDNRHDTEVASILEGIGKQHGGLNRLNLVNCIFLEQPSWALELHFSTLVYLNLYSLWAPSAQFRDVLCFCPRLEDLLVGCVLVRDIVNGGDWVCHQLQTLTICFQLEEGEQDLQHQVFERLSGLVRLEHLSVDCCPSADRHGIVEFRLENGLGQLASLQRLKTLNFDGCCPQLSMDEVAWMKVYWKNLTMKGGSFHREKQEDDNLKTVMKLFGLIEA